MFSVPVEEEKASREQMQADKLNQFYDHVQRTDTSTSNTDLDINMNLVSNVAFDVCIDSQTFFKLSDEPSTYNEKELVNLYISMGIMVIDVDSSTLNSYEQFFINAVVTRFYKTRKQIPLDLNLAAIINKTDMSRLCVKSVLANFMSKPIQRVVHFAKQLPDFGKLSAHDQVCLLRGGALEVIICSSSSLYDSIANKMTNMVSADRQVQGSDTSNIHMDLLKRFWSEEAFVKTIGFLKSMHALGIDETTLALFLSVIIFSPDRQGLINKSTITRMQSKYSFLLKKFIMAKYRASYDTTRLYNNLLLKLIELRTLKSMHLSMLDDADNFLLDPFATAVMNADE